MARLPRAGGGVSVRRDVARYARFLLVGVGNAAVDLAVLNLCVLFWPTRSPLAIFLYNTLAVTCAIANSYVWNRRFTFSDAVVGSRERTLFWLQGLVNIAVNDGVVVGLSRYLLLVRGLPLLVSGNLAKAAAMFISSSVSYVVLRLVVFRGSSARSGDDW